MKDDSMDLLEALETFGGDTKMIIAFLRNNTSMSEEEIADVV
jgi:hypothetical protein